VKTFFVWALLASLMGNPLGALFVVVGFLVVTDQLTFRFLPGPWHWWQRRQRAAGLRADLATNPHDRRARRELGLILVEQSRHAEAVATLAPNLAAGDDDAETLLAMACARMGVGDAAGRAEGERLFAAIEARQASFRQGELFLARGRFRLGAGEVAAATDDLRRFVKERPGTVEGRALLVKALRARGARDEAAKIADDGWNEYAQAPGFRRRIERRWAWTLRPSRPLTYAGLLLAALTALAAFAPHGGL